MEQNLGIQNFKVEEYRKLKSADESEFQQYLNIQALSGWMLHSITPQTNVHGETEINIIVFKNIKASQ